MNLTEVVHADCCLYCLCNEALVIFDVTDPLAPNELSRLQLSFHGQSLVVQSGFAYIASIDRIHAVDVSNPLEPRIIAECPLWGIFQYMCLNDNLLYVGEMVDHNARYYDKALSPRVRIEVFDISEPVEPYPIGSCDVPTEYFEPRFGENGTGLMMQRGNLLFVRGTNVYSLKRSFAPVLISARGGGVGYDHCRFFGDYLCGIYRKVGISDEGICVDVVDTSVPANLTTKGSWRVGPDEPSWQMMAASAAASEDRLLISWGASEYHQRSESSDYYYGLIEISIANPSKPMIVREETVDRWFEHMFFVDSHLCVFDQSAIHLLDLESLNELWTIEFTDGSSD